MGKLLAHFGEDRIVGLNAARVYGVQPEAIRKAQWRDPVNRARAEYAGEPAPSHRTYGPRIRRELTAFLKYTQDER